MILAFGTGLGPCELTARSAKAAQGESGRELLGPKPATKALETAHNQGIIQALCISAPGPFDRLQ